jgi:hypothetical protein
MDGGGLEPLCSAAGAGAPGCWGRRVSVGVGVQGFSTLKAFEALLYSVGTAASGAPVGEHFGG